MRFWGKARPCASITFEKHIIPVSPNSFYAYLHTILLGLRGLKVEERAREIITHLGSLRGQLVRFQEEFRKLGKHLEQSKGSFDSAQRQLEKFGDRLAAVETPPLLPADEEPAKNIPRRDRRGRREIKSPLRASAETAERLCHVH